MLFMNILSQTHTPIRTLIDEDQVIMLKDSIGDPQEAKEFFSNIIELFQSDVGEILDQMEKLKHETIVEMEIRKNIHFIAGAAANVGLHQLAFKCREYETAMGDQLPLDQSVGEIIWEVQKSFRESVEAFHRMVEEI